MCGRFSLHVEAAALAEVFQLPEEPSWTPRYNIAPSQAVATIAQTASSAHQFRLLRWGLIPSWAKDEAIGNKLINARAETVAEKPSFRAAFKQRRCLILADGFYEWQRLNTKKKQPHYFQRSDAQPFAFAGLWEHWQHGEAVIDSCTIITTQANELLEPIHDRMPVMLAAD
ncbi:SOS response-associated peptidase, partial [Leptolyngbya sp. FACHB-36]|uniref:SOS response-associated peptidase n=1 Tax=Leptolyngbya sp. FACHB-36 TaxID=2692808 RepID=UPI0016808D95